MKLSLFTVVIFALFLASMQIKFPPIPTIRLNNVKIQPIIDGFRTDNFAIEFTINKFIITGCNSYSCDYKLSARGRFQASGCIQHKEENCDNDTGSAIAELIKLADNVNKAYFPVNGKTVQGFIFLASNRLLLRGKLI